ncbi:hypothetical protein HIM_06261 [Hirsutella minnesotensis 3608]|uniref:Serine hydrolase domain-containing protein n=1 Tax=Hirsutella minnesotensis 3608 TaxID=1043627 RepID=A0A0F7ZNS4_9HYPO|nr:hypothetical protein HIM_06261 [Hirsutella minnesotensis 3608]
MKFLCLHGSFGSAVNFQVQLAPFVTEVERSTPGRFSWIDGFHRADPPKGFDQYFGSPPLYKFVGYDGVMAINELVGRLQSFPASNAPEDTIRQLVRGDDVYSGDAVRRTVDRLLDIIQADPEIEGILGYSEGAMTAATLILEEKLRWESQGVPRRIKCAIFFAGWPPVRLLEQTVEPMLADESEDLIDVPTCHIIGCKDPYVHGALALFNMCDPDTAQLFDHGQGHTLPRDEKTISELACYVQTTIDKCVQV